MKAKIGFIGCGNMGSALIKGISKCIDPSEIFITDSIREKADALAAQTGTIVSDSETIAKECRYVFLAVKPQVLPMVLENLKPVLHLRTDMVLVSMAAGVSIDRIKGYSDCRKIIRMMPNMPAAVGEGMTVFCTDGVSDEDVSEYRSFMRETGRLSAVDEELIDAGCALSGCGPAFVFMFIEALAEGGVKCGLSWEKAQLLAAQTVLGAAKQLLETGKQPEVLIDAVCSPGGATIEGVHSLEKSSFCSDCADAVIAAYKRTKEL